MKKILIFYFIFVNLSFANIEEYVNKAEELQLYNNKQWETLLHYKNNKSIINNESFFLSKNGIKNKKDELFETIKGFYSEDLLERENYQHPICKYPARFSFLNKYLNFKNLPKVNCIKYNEFYNEIKPESLTLIFPTTYINNPASMFGHNLIRIDKEDAYKKNSHINSIIINYGADTKGETNGIIYAFKGVFGLYDGFFSAMPYYKMTNNYNNLENRDIWEYKLSYTKEDAIFYTQHIWELMDANINYYFFKKNCAYLILESLNILRPETDLTASFYIYTTPIDVIKILKENNFIVENKYRPSMTKQIQIASKSISNNDIKKIKKFIKKDINLDLENSLSYQVGYKFLEYNKIKNNIDLQTYRKKSFYFLKNVNSLNNEDILISEYEFPENGHKINKFGISFGTIRDNDYLKISYKPSYHTLIDDNYGYDFSSEISFFNTELRYYFNEKKIDIETIDFIKIKSIPIQDNFFKPLSFTVFFGINNLYDEYNVFMLDVNGGITLGNKMFSSFVLFGPKINASNKFDNKVDGGANAIIGFRFNTKYLKTIFEYKINRVYPIKYNYEQINIENNLIITQNLYFNLKFQRFFYKKFDNYNNFNLGLQLLF